MPPQHGGRYGLMNIPYPAGTLSVRYASLADRDVFDRSTWAVVALTADAANAGWWQWDVDALGLADGSYEYEFLMDGNADEFVADPYADEITRFDGYRGVFHVAGGVRVKPAFRWDAVVEAGAGLAQNNKIVIYEMPLKWMTAAKDNPLVDLGTFEETVFEHLDAIAATGVNCIELLPIQDSPQTLDWGYGTRFYYAPDFDMGGPVDLKFFIKSCHARGIRVLLDVVMAFFHPACPLHQLAPGWFADTTSTTRNTFGNVLFEFNAPAYGNYMAAQEFLCQMAEFWVNEYHVDGFRIDDFQDIANWSFVQTFHDRAWAASVGLFPAKPFLVVAEDSSREFAITSAATWDGAKVVDGIWNFGFQQELRLLATGSMGTSPGQATRTERVEHFLSNQGVWNGYNGSFDPGYADMTCAVNYVTSHDVANAPRMMNVMLGPVLVERDLGDGGIANIAAAANATQNACMPAAVAYAMGPVFGVFALILTSVGIPMFLAGDEFGDVHDTDYNAVEPKQQDPVQWARQTMPNGVAFQGRVGALVKLRTSHAALGRDEIDFFYFHPTFDLNNGTQIPVFAYARTAGNALGAAGQVIVVANMSEQSFAAFSLPGWPWAGMALTEIAGISGAPVYAAGTDTLTVSLDAFQVRVFSC